MQIDKEDAIKIANNINFDNWTSKEIFLFQMSQERLLMDFNIFHKATQDVLGRPVFTHEFVDDKRLFNEFIMK
ncbi:hypothetical protein [Halanaerobium salsuginis]|uniref:DUF7736 domain-containing protein n=1 Tax=Halanaerobium salsuginis TaxID=29563 RepID=A0A1I4EVX8_9FIRM|nr:hypothetical protein [Halanaerobium salsuginis]SFL09905.1 hypothetical protein SAMN02983006_00180 [Halanaerobium salsuginis]